ncbi:uncharacterized protein LOC131005235 [Salvia miltiorrhiza]|uniref:uncharacterized protein LOC131005235 n=1 Tax=Salvia miltiorrhiza TaxID=226208 RepID=UPI0025AB5F0D|nr:uncharacterized protein LOC131005235 [Salvia miltiorrhiza]
MDIVVEGYGRLRCDGADVTGTHRHTPFLLRSSICDSESVKMGYVQEARENHVKKKVEEALRSKMKQKALKECDQYVSKYAECAVGRTLFVVWKCRGEAKELNTCLHQYPIDNPPFATANFHIASTHI